MAIPQADGSPDVGAPMRRFSIIRESEVGEDLPRTYGGNGTISARYFRFNQAPAPANFVIYDMPPGSSEGVHIHPPSGPTAYDEYYYVIEGEGEMEIDGCLVPIKAGDHVHAPIGVAHGVRNIGEHAHLRIFLTFISVRRQHI